MAKFLKNFGLGLIFMICSPILAALVVIAGVFGIVYFLFESVRIVIRFFGGYKPFKELEIDARVEIIKKKLDLSLATEPAAPAAPPQPQTTEKTVYIQQNYYQGVPPQVPQAPSQPNPEPLPNMAEPAPLPTSTEPVEPLPLEQEPLASLPPVDESSQNIPTGPDIFNMEEELADITFGEDEDEE